jgi:type I restriction enzyme R subunit
LNIIGRYIHLEKVEKTDSDGKKYIVEKLTFPRYHQLEVVNLLLATARKEGAGHKYLIQHSAGSGKSNSIAWLSHQLASLHNDADEKIFDSVIVITDRTVLDNQLQETISNFEHKSGVVCRINNDQVKSKQLAKALTANNPIIIVTIQTFPFVIDEIQKQISTNKKRYAVIIDEAHSSQTGEASRRLKQALTTEKIDDEEELTSEDLLLAEMAARKFPPNISFFAFTATPKPKTLEIFGRVPDPALPPSEKNLPEPFHIYSMRQAIEEGFILDVLKNYTPYKMAYKLAHNGKDYDDKEVEKAQALKQLVKWVRLHQYNISQKVQIIVEHYRSQIAFKLNGQAKAMVVTASRKEAVRYKLAMDKYIKDQSYKNLATLVAFSGEVSDPESGPDKFTESNMNPNLKGMDLRRAFAGKDYQILLVANKFQTGFDQKLLCAMYVDKKLSGVAAVQTLSRLNRTCAGKTDTFVLDFVNDPEEIIKSFEPYYKTAQLAGISDPNIVHDIQSKLDNAQIYTTSEVDAFANAYYNPKAGQKELQAHIAPAVDRYRDRRKQANEKNDKKESDALDLFRKDMASFIRIYDFLSQIIDYGDSDLEKRHTFYNHLLPWLKQENQTDPIDLSSVQLTHYRLNDLGKREIKLGSESDESKLQPLTEAGTGKAREPAKAYLSEIIQKLNTLFEGELSDADLLNYANHIKDKMLENEELAQQAAINTKEQFAMGDFNKVLTDAVIEGLDRYQSMASQVLGNEKVKKGFEELMLDLVYRSLKDQTKDPSVTGS